MSMYLGLLTVLIGCTPKGEIETVKPTIVVPIPSQAKYFESPMPKVSSLESGGKLWLLEDHDLPVVVMNVVLPGGSVSDVEGSWGLAELANQMLLESAGERSSTELSTLLYELAVDLGIQTTRQHTIIQISVHKDRLESALKLISEMIFSPSFLTADWDRIHEQHQAGLQQSRQDSSWVASQYAAYFLYGSTHPLGRPVRGTPKTVESLTVGSAQEWHQNRLKGASSRMGVMVVGDISEETVSELVEQYLTDFPPFDNADGFSFGVVPPVLVDAAISPPKTILVDMPGSEQTSIRILSRAYRDQDPKAVPADLAGIVMGGTFTSRLNAKLREEKGYTYGAGCGFVGGYYGNHLSVRTNVQTPSTIEAIKDLRMVLDTAKTGFSQDEHSKALSAYRADFVQMSGSRKELAAEMVDLYRLGDAPSSWNTELQLSQETTLEQMAETSKFFDPTRGVMVLVGDASVVSPMLIEAGIEFELGNIPE